MDKEEIRDILRSFDEDIRLALRDQHSPTIDQHEARLRAIEAALTVLMNHLADE